MSNILEERLREAASKGGIKVLRALVKENVNINGQNSMNGWSALHWACRRGHETVVQYLIASGANSQIRNNKGETPADVCCNSTILNMLGYPGESDLNKHNQQQNFVPNYLANAPLNMDVPLDTDDRRTYNSFRNVTYSPQLANNNNLVLRIRIANSSDPDFIEVEMPPSKLFYSALLNFCCEELAVKEMRVERIRKLPNTRLRNDNDVKRLRDYDSLELVLHDPHLDSHTTYPVVNTCKSETILY